MGLGQELQTSEKALSSLNQSLEQRLAGAKAGMLAGQTRIAAVLQENAIEVPTYESTVSEQVQG